MVTDPRDNDARTVWQLQQTDAAPLDISGIRGRTLKFHGQIWRRNLGEYAASALVVVLFGLSFWNSEGFWTRAGALLVVGGTLYMCYELHRRASLRPPPPGESSVVFHRAELERQRDALQSVWRWYLAPFAPGLIVLTVGREVDNPPLSWVSLLVNFALLVAVFFGVFKLNQSAARELQRDIDELSELERDY